MMQPQFQQPQYAPQPPQYAPQPPQTQGRGYFEASRAPGFKRAPLGATVGGVVLAPFVEEQQRQYDRDLKIQDRPFKFYKNGDPVMQAVIEVQAWQPQGEDGGKRTLYIASSGQRQAVREALAPFRVSGPEVGSYLTLTWTHSIPGGGDIDKKIYSAVYIPPGQPFPDLLPCPEWNLLTPRVPEPQAWAQPQQAPAWAQPQQAPQAPAWLPQPQAAAPTQNPWVPPAQPQPQYAPQPQPVFNPLA